MIRFLFCLILPVVAAPLCGVEPAFEVASIKPSLVSPMEMYGNPELRPVIRIDPAHATFRNQSLLRLIAFAWGVKDYQVTGPVWMGSARFEIVAVLPKGASKDKVPEMLRTLLAERFKLGLHPENRELAVLALIVLKDRAKLSARPADWKGPNDQRLQPQTMEQVARVLSGATGRTVIDQTGLKGEYMVPVRELLQASVEQQVAASSAELAARGIDVPRDSNVDVFGLIQKCGLKLEARKLPTTVLIVDHIHNKPTEN
jgi:uncharacterized protein (TIGR03435 family)